MEFQVVQVLFLLTATNAIEKENPTERHAKATRKAERSLRTTRETGGQKERAAAGRKENWPPQGDKRDDKRNKGHAKGTNKAEARGKEAQKSGEGGGGRRREEKKSAVIPRAGKTADARPTFRRQVSRRS